MISLLALVLFTSIAGAFYIFIPPLTQGEDASGLTFDGAIILTGPQNNVCAAFWDDASTAFVDAPFYVDDCIEPAVGAGAGIYGCTLPIGEFPAGGGTVTFSINAFTGACPTEGDSFNLLFGPWGLIETTAVNLVALNAAVGEASPLVVLAILGLTALTIGFLFQRMRATKS